jgi:hypothetical protein
MIVCSLQLDLSLLFSTFVFCILNLQIVMMKVWHFVSNSHKVMTCTHSSCYLHNCCSGDFYVIP